MSWDTRTSSLLALEVRRFSLPCLWFKWWLLEFCSSPTLPLLPCCLSPLLSLWLPRSQDIFRAFPWMPWMHRVDQRMSSVLPGLGQCSKHRRAPFKASLASPMAAGCQRVRTWLGWRHQKTDARNVCIYDPSCKLNLSPQWRRRGCWMSQKAWDGLDHKPKPKVKFNRCTSLLFQD